MDNKIFDECLSRWKNSDGSKPFWGELAQKFGYSESERLRGEFKRERKRRGISKETISNNLKFKAAVFDIEMLPMGGLFFDIWNQNIGLEQITQDAIMLSWAAKLLNEPEIKSEILSPKEARKKDDFRIVSSIWNYLNGIDIVIGQNIVGFDLKKLNVRFLYHNLPPLKPLKTIDTYLVAKQVFDFPSNSLKSINRFLGIKQKIENSGFKLWKNCYDGDSESLKEMLSYNEGDVFATEDLYYRFRPYIKNHPNLSLYNESDEMQCPNCGSVDLTDCGFYFTPTGKFQSMRCNSCGAVSRMKNNELSKEKKKSLLKG